MSEDLKTNDYQIEQLTCPSCNYEDAKFITHILDIPYYTDFAMVNISCRECGFRSSDFMNLTQKEPIRMEYKIEGEQDGRTKVVRASQGVVGIPELGIRIEPSGEGSTWIRNIEGILEDMKEKLIISLKHSDTKDEKRPIKQRLKKLKSLIKYEQPFTIVVEDPSGNSLILPADESKLKRQIMKN